MFCNINFCSCTSAQPEPEEDVELGRRVLVNILDKGTPYRTPIRTPSPRSKVLDYLNKQSLTDDDSVSNNDSISINVIDRHKDMVETPEQSDSSFECFDEDRESDNHSRIRSEDYDKPPSSNNKNYQLPSEPPERTINRQKELLYSCEKRRLSSSNQKYQINFLDGVNVTLSNFSFPLNVERQSSRNREFYVFTLICGDVIKISSVVEARERGVIFGDSFNFNKLSSNFTIDMRLYSFIYKQRTLAAKAKHLVKKVCLRSRGRFSKFKLCGHLDITGDHENESSYNMNTENVSSLSGVVKFNLKVTNLIRTIKNRYCGILNVGSIHLEKVILWALMYCILEDDRLWLFTSERHASIGKRLAAKQIQNITQADAVSESPKNKTLKITGKIDNGDGKLRSVDYYLCALDKEGFERWKSVLSDVVQSVKKPAVSRNKLVD